MVLLLDHDRVKGPLESFQSTRVTEPEMKKLVLDMNMLLGRPEWASHVEIAFKAKWDAFLTTFKAISPNAETASDSPADTNTEILRRMAALERLITAQSEQLQRLPSTNRTIVYGGSKPQQLLPLAPVAIAHALQFPTREQRQHFVLGDYEKVTTMVVHPIGSPGYSRCGQQIGTDDTIGVSAEQYEEAAGSPGFQNIDIILCPHCFPAPVAKVAPQKRRSTAQEKSR
jgi:hypothetical protein